MLLCIYALRSGKGNCQTGMHRGFPARGSPVGVPKLRTPRSRFLGWGSRLRFSG